MDYSHPSTLQPPNLPLELQQIKGLMSETSFSLIHTHIRTSEKNYQLRHMTPLEVLVYNQIGQNFE